MNKNIILWIKDFFYKYLFFVFLFLGIIVLISSKLGFDENVNDLLTTIGTTVLGAGVMSAILKSFQFSNLFKEELEKIIYSSEFLSKRKDIKDIWKRVSRALYKEKFPEIADEIEETIYKYLPVSIEAYTQNLDLRVTVERIDNEYMRITEYADYDLIAPDIQNTISLTFNSIAKKNNSSDVKSKITISQLTVNQIDKLCEPNTITTIESEEKIKIDYKLKLSGNKIYKISRCIVKEVNIKMNSERLFLMSKYGLCRNIRIQISAPSDFTISIQKIGMMKFLKENIIKSQQNQTNLIKTYEGLILPKQGFRYIVKEAS